MSGQRLLMGNYGDPPVTFVRGSGTELFDDTGKRYLDFLCGLAVTSLGHSHPRVAAALAGQAGTLLHVSNLFDTEPHLEVAARLDALVRSGTGATGPGRVLFQNSGAEANEAAIKLARKHQGRGRHVVVSAMRSFHGRTLATLAATGQPEKHEPFQPLPEGFRHAAWNDLAAFEAVLDPSVGAILVEPLQGEGGVNPADVDFLVGLRRLCDERGMLLILDEIQTGLGRTGRWFGFQHAGIRPDIVTVAKALGNGVPIGAVWAEADVAAAFRPGDHGSTFGGQPLAASAAREVLRVMEEIDAPACAAARGATLTGLLEALPGVSGVRGLGLLLAAELDPTALDDQKAADVARACLEAGLVVNGVTPTALRLAPPLTVTDDELAEGVAILGDVLAQPTPRQDLDALFLAATPLQARQIKPTLAFQYAADLPVYATSHAYQIDSSGMQNTDLDGLLIAEIPWLLEQNDPLYSDVTGNWPQAGGALGRLYAMGVDTQRIFARLPQMREYPDTHIEGATGELTLDSTGRIQRLLPWGQIRNGVLEPAAPSDSGAL